MDPAAHLQSTEGMSANEAKALINATIIGNDMLALDKAQSLEVPLRDVPGAINPGVDTAQVDLDNEPYRDKSVVNPSLSCIFRLACAVF